MYIRIEPKDFMMYSVFLYFDEESADAEDDDIRTYLAERRLVPKRQSKAQIEEREYGVMSFGAAWDTLRRADGTMVRP